MPVRHFDSENSTQSLEKQYQVHKAKVPLYMCYFLFLMEVLDTFVIGWETNTFCEALLM